MLIENVNDIFTPAKCGEEDTRMKTEKNGRVALMRAARNGVGVAAIMVSISCSGQPEERVRQRAGEFEHPEQAQAGLQDASTDASVDTSTEKTANEPTISVSDTGPADLPPMPDNPAHVSLRFPRIAEEAIVRLESGDPLPFPHKVTPEGDHLVVTLYLPKDREVWLEMSPVNAELESTGEIRTLAIIPGAKLGTVDVNFTGSAGKVRIDANTQNDLVLGENVLDGPFREGGDFVSGMMVDVVKGGFKASENGTYRIEWSGEEGLFSFLNSPPTARTASFEIEMKAGQELALWAVLNGSRDPVTITVSNADPTCAPSPGAEE